MYSVTMPKFPTYDVYVYNAAGEQITQSEGILSVGEAVKFAAQGNWTWYILRINRIARELAEFGHYSTNYDDVESEARFGVYVNIYRN